MQISPPGAVRLGRTRSRRPAARAPRAPGDPRDHDCGGGDPRRSADEIPEAVEPRDAEQHGPLLREEVKRVRRDRHAATPAADDRERREAVREVVHPERQAAEAEAGERHPGVAPERRARIAREEQNERRDQVVDDQEVRPETKARDDAKRERRPGAQSRGRSRASQIPITSAS